MFYNAKNSNVKIGDTDMDYISFGSGAQNLIIIPGLGDALKTVKGTAIPFAMMYRIFAKKYTVFVFSRKNKLNKGYSTRDMAREQAAVMKKLGISKVSVMGVSEGGVIAQYLAIDYPKLIEKLVLVVTFSRQNSTLKSAVTNWIRMAEANDYKALYIDTAEKSYSEKRLKAYRPLYSVLGRIGKLKDWDRFIIQANACMNHDSYDEIRKIQCPTFVVGGDNDRVVGAESSKEIAEQISGSKLKIYEGLGHGTYEEAKDFNRQVLDFLDS